MPQGICLTWNGGMHKQRRNGLLLRGLASGSIYMYMVVSLSWKQTTNHSNVHLARRRNHLRKRWVLWLQCQNFKVVYRSGKTNIADTLSRMNQSNPRDLSSEKEDIVRFVAMEATPVALTTREIERESEFDPELQSVWYYIETNHYISMREIKFLPFIHVVATLNEHSESARNLTRKKRLEIFRGQI